MQGLIQCLSLVYLAALTVLLLVADPLRWIGAGGNLASLRVLQPAAHLLAFVMLAVLTLAARWPVPRWAVVLLLVVYAGITEVAQSFLPPRTAEMADWLQDLVGIGIGAAVCWMIGSAYVRLTAACRRPRKPTPPDASENWELLQNVVSRSSIVRSPSWWN